jgi:excinuclease ABC subunit C
VRIEGFDISSSGGGEPVGSMVTFVGGKAVKKWYRKFAVRGITGQDDFAMMGEVVRRRFGHDEDFGGMPDLVLIDGGKGQLASALAAMNVAGCGSVPVVSLAKERSRGGRTVSHERIFLPGRKNPVVLPPNDPVLLLLMRIRDEAHRFALSFHRARRAKQYTGGRRKSP